MTSILIPTYNYDCCSLINDIHNQCEQLKSENGFEYEIIIADDCSNHPIWKNNQVLSVKLDNCRFIRSDKNMGRSKVRNWLARTAKGDQLIFIDSHMTILSDHYIKRYLLSGKDICQGGYLVQGTKDQWSGNLRYKYEKRSQSLNQKKIGNSDNHDFHTSNFFIKRTLFLQHPLDESISRYGYEDVLYGKQLHDYGIVISSIDNPVGFSSFEPNDIFVNKTEESLITLNELRHQIEGYSRLLSITHKIFSLHLDTPLRWLFMICKKPMRKNLCSHHPYLVIFDIYKLLFFIYNYHD